jgi:hypothetical protein
MQAYGATPQTFMEEYEDDRDRFKSAYGGERMW